MTGAFTPELAITHPEAIAELHREMRNAGSEVLQVMAFYGSREKLATVGYADKTIEINQAATRIAQEVAGDDLLVAGDLSSTWKWKPDDADSERLVADMFDEQIEAQAGVDFFIGELFYDLGEAMLCLDRIKRHTSLPAMITMSFRASNVSDDGFTAGECARMLSDAGADIVGLNCMNDPERMYPHIAEMRSAFDGYLAAQPVGFRCTDETPWFSGLPSFPDRLEPTQLTRYELGEFAARGEGDGRQLHRRLLRLQGDPHAGDGEGAGEVHGGVVMGASAGLADERDREQLGPPRRGPTTLTLLADLLA